MTERIRVLIADDREVTREGLQRLLEGVPDLVVVGEAATIYQAVRLATECGPDVILIDLQWSGDNTVGISAIEYIRQHAPSVKIIAITVYEDLISQARAAGAHLAITKDFGRDRLHTHIREVFQAEGLPKFASTTERRMAPTLDNPLTERESEVLPLLADGLRDREIAAKLSISEHTARNHVASILSKLEVTNRTKAVVVALRRGLLKLS